MSDRTVRLPAHHVQQEVCSARAAYREGRKAKAVKVYTVNQESQYLLVQGVPSVGATQELVKLFAVYGAIQEYRILDDYPAPMFTEVYLIKFKKIFSARLAKRKLDDWSFFGGVLHVCYAPEYETVQETKEKLQERRKSIAAKIRQYGNDGTYSSPLAPSHQASSTSFEGVSKERETGTQRLLPREGLQPVVNTPGHSLGSHNDVPGTSGHSESGTVYQPHITNHNVAMSRVSTTYSPGNPQHGHRQPQNAQSVHSANIGSEATHHNEGLPGLYSNQQFGMRSVPSQSHPGDIPVQVEEPQFELRLPPPPKPNMSHTGSRSTDSRLGPGYTFARVPTANAVFPEGFDARTDQDNDDHHGNMKQPESPPLQVSETGSDSGPVSMQEKIDEQLKKKSELIVKDYKVTGRAPKFIPRQAIAKTKTQSQPLGTVSGKHDEQLDRQLKKDAFTLGLPQGPLDPHLTDKKVPDPADQSVTNTVKSIRKRIRELSEEAINKAKKMKEQTS